MTTTLGASAIVTTIAWLRLSSVWSRQQTYVEEINCPDQKETYNLSFCINRKRLCLFKQRKLVSQPENLSVGSGTDHRVLGKQ